MDPDFFQTAIRTSPKQSLEPGMGSMNVPQEEAYQYEMARILRTWLPSPAVVILLSNFGERKGTEILIEIGPRKYLFELVASQPIPDLIEIFAYTFTSKSFRSSRLKWCFVSRAPVCTHIVDVHQHWIIHFTLKQEDDDYRYPFPDEALKVNVVHIWHDAPFCNKIVKTKEGKELVESHLS